MNSSDFRVASLLRNTVSYRQPFMGKYAKHMGLTSSSNRLLLMNGQFRIGAMGRKRCSFSQRQVATLEHQFGLHRYLTGDQRSRLAAELCLTEQQIKIWFQNRRYKTKQKQPTAQHATASESKANSIDSSFKPQPATSNHTDPSKMAVELSQNLRKKVELATPRKVPLVVLIRDGERTAQYHQFQMNLIQMWRNILYDYYKRAIGRYYL